MYNYVIFIWYSLYCNDHESSFSQSKDNHLWDFCNNEAVGATGSTKHWNACQRGTRSSVWLYVVFLSMVQWIFLCYYTTGILLVYWNFTSLLEFY